MQNNRQCETHLWKFGFPAFYPPGEPLPNYPSSRFELEKCLTGYAETIDRVRNRNEDEAFDEALATMLLLLKRRDFTSVRMIFNILLDLFEEELNKPTPTNSPFVTETFLDRKSTRLNSSHGYISYAVFCLKKKKSNKRAVH